MKTITSPEGELDLQCPACDYFALSAWPISADLWQADYYGGTVELTKAELMGLMASVTCQDCEA